MTKAQFEQLRPYLNSISPERVAAARMALVDDLSMQSIADHFGWSSRQTVSDAVSRVFQAWSEHQEATLLRDVLDGTLSAMVPPGWAPVTLLAPPELATKFRKEVAIAFSVATGLQHPSHYKPGATPPRKKRTAAAKA